MQDAAYCKTQALLFRERAAKATTPEEWLACLDLAKRWDQEARRLDPPGAEADDPDMGDEDTPDADGAPEAA